MELFIGDPEERSKGYAQSALRQTLSYAFTELGLKRVYLGAHRYNPAPFMSIRNLDSPLRGHLGIMYSRRAAGKT